MKSVSRIQALILTLLGILLVGFVDYITGIEIRVFPLYFLPLMFAARFLNRIEVLGFAFLASIIWVLSMLLGGREYSRSYIWIINFFTQGSTFVIVALLFSKLNDALKLEVIKSHTDALTGLSNSRSFYEQTNSVLRLCRRKNFTLTIVYIDLDNFKTANDKFGHSFGDEILRKVAELLKKNFRSSDILARMGGDEFALILPEMNAKEAEKKLGLFKDSLLASPEIAKCSISASIGAVTYTKVPEKLDSMIRAADELMYKVKSSGKNHIMVESY